MIHIILAKNFKLLYIILFNAIRKTSHKTETSPRLEKLFHLSQTEIYKKAQQVRDTECEKENGPKFEADIQESPTGARHRM